jgi:hypothetical protein
LGHVAAAVSKLAALLQAMSAANPANPANPETEIRNFRKIRRGSGSDLNFTPDLERRIEAMAKRWDYSPNELASVLAKAKASPAAWISAVAYDEEHESEYRQRGLLTGTSTIKTDR